MMLTRTRREGTMLGIIIALVTMLIVTWSYISVDKASKLQQPQEPMVRVSGVLIKFGDEDEAMISLVIDMGDGKKYGSNVTIPVYPLTKTDSTSEENK